MGNRFEKGKRVQSESDKAFRSKSTCCAASLSEPQDAVLKTAYRAFEVLLEDFHTTRKKVTLGQHELARIPFEDIARIVDGRLYSCSFSLPEHLQRHIYCQNRYDYLSQIHRQRRLSPCCYPYHDHHSHGVTMVIAISKKSTALLLHKHLTSAST